MTRIGKCGHCGTEPWTEGELAPCDDSYCTFPYFSASGVTERSGPGGVETTSIVNAWLIVETITSDGLSKSGPLRVSDISKILGEDRKE